MQNTTLLVPVLQRISALFPDIDKNPVLHQSLIDNVRSMIAEAHERYAAGGEQPMISASLLADEHLATGALNAEYLQHPAGPMLAAEVLFDEYLPVFIDEVGAQSTDELLAASRALHAGIWSRFPAGAIAYTEALRQRVTSANMDSRAQIARDLHDRVAHSVLAGLQRVEMAQIASAPATRSSNEPTEALEAATRLLRAALVDVQNLAVSLHARVGDDDLHVALERHARDLFACDHSVTFENHGDPMTLVNWRAEEALTIVLEALANWRKHAAGSSATVICEWGENAVEIVVSDDGPGFDPDAVSPGRLGQSTMRERAALIGAPFSIDSTPGEGTTVVLTIPYGAH
jgi:signal transduction histidine kinase